MSSIELPPLLDGFSFGMVMMVLSSFLVVIRKLFYHRGPLDDIPGPFLARWTSLWLAYQVRMGKRYLVIDALHKVKLNSPVSFLILNLWLLRNMVPSSASRPTTYPSHTKTQSPLYTVKVQEPSTNHRTTTPSSQTTSRPYFPPSTAKTMPESAA